MSPAVGPPPAASWRLARSAARRAATGARGPRQSRTRWSSSRALSDESRRSRRGGSGLDTRARSSGDRGASNDLMRRATTDRHVATTWSSGEILRSQCSSPLAATPAPQPHARPATPRAIPRLDPGRGYERARCRASAASPRLGRRRRASVVDARCPREATSSSRAARRRRAASA